MLHRFVAVAAICFGLNTLGLENGWICSGFSMLAAGAGPERHYPRDREIDIKHFKLDVTPNFIERSVAGTATLTFEPIAKPVVELKLDAVDLRVSAVSATVPVQAWQNTAEKLIVTFASAIPIGQSISVMIDYSAQPEK